MRNQQPEFPVKHLGPHVRPNAKSTHDQPDRYYPHPRDMTPEERFELITDIFVEAFVEQRLAEIIAEMKATSPKTD